MYPNLLNHYLFQLLTSEDSIVELSISEDKSLVAVGSSNSSLVFVLQLQSGQIVCKSPLNEQVTSLAWSGRHLYVGGEGGCVALVDWLESNGAVRQILALDSSIVKLTTHGGLLIASTLT